MRFLGYTFPYHTQVLRGVLALVLVLMFPPSLAYAADASLFISPITGTYVTGRATTLRVMVSSGGEALNAVEGKLVYDPKDVEILSVSKDQSSLSSWTTEPSIDNTRGELIFGGLTASSSVIDRGTVFQFVMKPLRSGDVHIRFASGAAVHAADGTGGNLLTSMSGGVYLIEPKEVIPELRETPLPTIQMGAVASGTSATSSASGEVLGAATSTVVLISSTHPNQNGWYALASSTISWDLPADVVDSRLSFNKKENAEGYTSYVPPVHEKTLTRLQDGVWYFHLTRAFSDGRTDTTHYRVGIDTAPPTGVTLAEKARADNSDPNAVFVVAATDTTSGVDHYEFTFDDAAPLSWVDDGSHEYHAAAASVGAHKLVMVAVDRAGNKTSATHLTFAVAHLPTPVVTLTTERPREGKEVAFRITAIPNGKLQLVVSADGRAPVMQDLTADQHGAATALVSSLLLPGTYHAHVTVRDERGGISEVSAPADFTVTPSYIGVVKRHPFIPLAGLGIIVLLFLAHWLWRHAGEDDEEEDAEEEREAIAVETPRRTPPKNEAGPFRPKVAKGVIDLRR